MTATLKTPAPGTGEPLPGAGPAKTSRRGSDPAGPLPWRDPALGLAISAHIRVARILDLMQRTASAGPPPDKEEGCSHLPCAVAHAQALRSAFRVITGGAA